MTPAARATPELVALRVELEAIDSDIVNLLARRMELARRIGAQKRAAGLPLQDPKREAQVVAAVARNARRAGLPEEAVRDIVWPIVAMCRRAQQDDAT